MPSEIHYVVLLFALFVAPRILQRFHLPAPVTCLLLGAAAALFFGLFAHDPTIALLSTLGIVSLFLFAGLDVDFAELRRELSVLVQHLVIGALTLLAAALILRPLLGLSARSATLVALALLTPSAGVILEAD